MPPLNRVPASAARLLPACFALCLASAAGLSFPAGALAAGPAAPAAPEPQAKADQGIPAWKPAAGVSGSVRVLVPDLDDPAGFLMQELASAYQKRQPGVKVVCEAAGAGREGLSVNVDGRGQGTVVAADALAVIVNAQNDVPALSTEQIKAILAGSDRAATWATFGAGGAVGGSSPSVVSYGDGASELRWAREAILGGAQVRSDAARENTWSGVGSRVGREPAAVGFVRALQVPASRVRTVRIGSGAAAVAPDAASVFGGRYPFRRTVAFTTAPKSDPERDFLRFVLSREGQDVVARQRFYSLDAAAAQAALAAIR